MRGFISQNQGIPKRPRCSPPISYQGLETGFSELELIEDDPELKKIFDSMRAKKNRRVNCWSFIEDKMAPIGIKLILLS